MSFVPTPRLLWLVFAAAVAGAVAGPLPELAPVWLLGLLGVGLAALGDVAACLSGVGPPEVTSEPAPRFTKDRAGAVRLCFANPGGLTRRIRFALGLPAPFASRDEFVWVSLPAGALKATIDWPCTPARRGRFRGVEACVEETSRFGLWSKRTRTALPCELRVYPNLFSGRRQLAALMHSRGLNGIRLRRTTGRGREFEKLRDYLPGDSFDEIHWKATAKRGRPVTKIFQVERTQELYVILDQSRLSGRRVETAEGVQTALEGYLAAALVLMLAAQGQGDRFGLIAHDDRVRVFLRAANNPSHYSACREAALGLEPSPRTPDMAEIVRHVASGLRRRALLFFLTDLTDPVLAEDFIRNIRVLSRQHLVYVCQTRGPDVAPVFEGAEADTDADVYRRLAGHIRWSEVRGLSQRLKPVGVTAGMLGPDSMAADLVSRYMEVKQRQAL